MNNFFREPLLHFLLLGALIFGVYQMVPSANINTKLVVSKERIQVLADAFQATWHRPATIDELNKLIDNYILEELYYREAVNLGLDQDDSVIRRRLQQKMEFISKDLSSIIDASDAELEAFLEKNSDKYRAQSSYSFEQIYIDPTKHDQPYQLAQKWLTDVEARKPDGDSTMLPQVMTLRSQQAINNSFGGGFAAYVVNAKPKTWSGPAISSFGLHLIYVTEIKDAVAPSLAQVREKVSRDWVFQQQSKIKSAMDTNLKKKYDITVEHSAYVGR